MRGFKFWLLLFLLPSALTAQSFMPNPDWRFDNFNSQNHFISRETTGLTADHHGYIWASSRGVQRFDGFKTADYSSFEQGNNALKDNYTDLIADSTGRIWASSAGLCYYNETAGKFIYVQPEGKPDLSYAYALSFQKNTLWFVCDYGLAKLDLHALKIALTSLKTVSDPLCTYRLNDSTLLVTSREKVYLYNIKTDTYSAKTLTYDHMLLKVFAVVKRGADIFLGTTGGLFAFNNSGDASLVCPATRGMIVSDMLFLPQDKGRRYLFLATDGQGIQVYDIALKKIAFSYMHDDANPYSLPNNIISRFFADKNGHLWISTNSGISMLDVTNQQLKMRFLNKKNVGEYSITKIARDAYDSTKVWMSADNRGMICMDWLTKRTDRVFGLGGEFNKIVDFVQVAKDKWLIITQKKVIEWNPRTGILVQKKLPVPDSLSLLYNIRKLILSNPATCFITSNRGLFKYDLSRHLISAVPQNNRKKVNDPLQYDLLSGFCEQGVLWIASRNGLFSYNIDKNVTTIYREAGDAHDYFFFSAAKGPGSQVICASRNGVAIFDRQKSNFKIIRTIAGFYKPYCTSVVSKNNMLWIGTEAGILNYDLVTHTSSRAEPESLLTQIFLTSPISFLGNEFVVGFRNGYAYFTPDLKNNYMPSDPMIEQVSVNNRPVRRASVFSHSENSLNIAFTAFLYTDPDHINFRYRLKNADDKWQYTQGQRDANYAQLPPGSYSFYVQSGINGIWNPHLAAFHFVIAPPYWATWWFRVLFLVAIAVGLYMLYRYRINHLLAIERIRERIASDFHDDIGAALSSISIFSEVADTQLEEQVPREQTREIIRHIAHQSQSMLDAMDDIIWAVNPQNDHFVDLAVRMREFAIPLLEAKDIKFDIDISEDLLNLRIAMQARKNIFLIFKESINNLLKHSGCAAIRVSLAKSSGWLELQISDNGKGFDTDAPHNRNGLKNMQKRAAEINGELKISSVKGKGTATRLRVNTI